MRATSPISAAPADPYVRKVAGVCDMHRVPVGSVAELAGFLAALDEDKHLAMDFWAVMGKMSDEGSAYLAGQPLNERMLEVVVEAVTGLSLAEVITSSEEMLGVVERLSRLLAGEDMNSPAVVVDDAPEVQAADVELKKPVGRAEIPSLTAMPSPGAGGGQTPLRMFRSRAEEMERAPVEIRPPLRAEERRADERGAAVVQPIDRTLEMRTPEMRAAGIRGPEVERGGMESIGARPFVAKPAVESPAAAVRPVTSAEDMALERLRLMHWALQNFPASSSARAEADLIAAKLSAAEIFGRYAPQPQGVEGEAAARVPASPPADEVSSSVVPGVPYWRLQEPVSLRIEGESRRLAPEPQAEILGKAGPVEKKVLDDLMHIPLSEFEDEPEIDRKIRVFGFVLSGVVVAGMAIGLLLGHIHGAGLWQSITDPVNDFHGTFWRRPLATLDIPNQLVVDPPPAPLPAPQPPVHKLTPRPAPTRAISTMASSKIRIDSPAVRIFPSVSVRSAPPATATNIESLQRPAGLTAGGGSFDSVTSPGGTGPLVVAGSVMEGNLLISRLPQYPDGAKAEGRVVMQVVINRDGTVGHIRVMEGDPVLRGAATDAVSKWRYRPYTVNGQPVDVLTTVAVEFKLDQ
jgi:TonB family protein